MKDSADTDPVFGEYIPLFPPGYFKYTRWMRFKEFWDDHIAEPLALACLAVCFAIMMHPQPVVSLVKLLLSVE